MQRSHLDGKLQHQKATAAPQSAQPTSTPFSNLWVTKSAVFKHRRTWFCASQEIDSLQDGHCGYWALAKGIPDSAEQKAPMKALLEYLKDDEVHQLFSDISEQT